MSEVNDAHAFLHFIKDYWPIIVGVFGFILSVLLVLRGKIPFMEKRIEDLFGKVKKLEDGKFISKNTLFDNNNQFKFQSVPVCTEMREECHLQQTVFQNNFCKKLDGITFELKEIVNDADKKREGTRYEITNMNTRLIETMTQMKTILARDRREETAEMVQLVVRQVIIEMKDGKKT